MKNLEILIKEHFGELSNEEVSIIRSYFCEEKLQKNDFFTQPDKICDKLSFVKSGILRVYALSDGKEITQWISTENFLLTEVMGFFFDQPNRWTIQALTATELLTITKTNYLKLCKTFPKWNVIEKRLILKCFGMLEDRVFSHLSMTAEERYDLYFEQNKELFNQVPLQYIASVLGMTAETLSRIRKRQHQNS
ncbi:Crp/Fnr family transcriptional regulator [Autumnicola musiva]|uniref:Crp/Fnr family transcriptional regulator n=1 Tax=Autumnicola musiva TaxID=3075589 RepID=A0ABU3D8T7_9FLAO|nr:Crp/Fnr family transcriptional regulator [Zunongwangia sp. F117]MDT0677939.1 Crp/Fnr family transcriptional regulator [Zunongwangia sp. F117]